MAEFDVVVVGGRCAGASLALLLAREGVRVLVLDQSEPTRDTLSTHALMRGGLVLLQRWGLLDRLIEAGTPGAGRTSFHYGDRVEVVEHAPLFAPRRTVLDPLIAAAAEEAGAVFRYGFRVADVRRDAGRVVGVVGRGGDEIEARFVVGADGRTSSIADAVGADVYRRGEHAAFMTYHYFENLEVDGIHWFYGDGIAGGMIPTNDGRVLVSGGTHPDRRRGDLHGQPDHGLWVLLDEVNPELRDLVQGATAVEHGHAFPGAVGFFRQPWGPGWALVGDAGHFKDPSTAHGITDAFRDAAFLAPALLAGLGGQDETAALTDFHRQRDELADPIFEATEQICSLDWTFDELQEVHIALSRAMQHETARLRNWDYNST